jgi:hypothetical protein
MATMYLLNILHRTLIHSKYILGGTIIWKPFNVYNNPWIHMEYGHSYTFKVYICKSYYIYPTIPWTLLNTNKATIN